ncbi:MAG: methyltransferase type 11 [Alphaproteobacteria bacterium]|nr:methyltransferase type 11 [Alphaproteobacteria bacterium]MBU2272521.1 methyltransferase type 11 [Alphaproteobacteria bacterium]MBU2419262.1 methyltransferase type 11 [Alphaproteobacteria bacterium]
MRPLLIPALCLAALTAACDGESVRISSTRTEDNDAKGALKVVQTLQCPQTMGSLTRKGSATAGGSVCTYAGPRGAEVSLHIVKLDGVTPAAALEAFEDRLSTAMPQTVAQLTAAAEQDAAGAAGATETPAAGDRASIKGPGVDIQTEGDDATVSLPGLHIESRGDQASVRIGGFHIDASDGDGAVNIEGSASGSGEGDSVSVQANQDAAEIRTSAGGEATRASWILTDNRPSEAGWRLVGYEARGPAGGPLVVATVRSRDRERGGVFEDAKELVTLNVGE